MSELAELAPIIDTPGIIHNIDPNTYSKEKVRDVMGDVHGQTHIGEVEAVAQRNQSQRDNVVADKLLKILAGFLQLQQEHNSLLCPVTRLQQVVRLEHAFMLAVGEPLKHGGRVKVPDIRSAHDIQPKRAEDTKVDRSVDLLHEAGGLALAPDSAPDSQRADHLLHDKLAREREDNGVKGDESDVFFALAVHDRPAGCLRGLRVG